MTLKFILTLVLLLTTSPAWAVKYWIATTGNDSNACSAIDGDADPGTYKLTPLNAITCLSSGDILEMKAGTYTGTGARIYTPTVSVPNGTASAYTTIEGAGVGVTIWQQSSAVQLNSIDNGRYIRVQNFTIDGVNRGAVQMEACWQWYWGAGVGHHNELINMELKNCHHGVFGRADDAIVRRVIAHDNGEVFGDPNPAGNGFYLLGARNLVEESEFYNNGAPGASASVGGQIWEETAGSADGFIVRRNKFHDNNYGPALKGNNGFFYDNESYNNRGYGLALFKAGILVANNLIYGNVTDAIQVGPFAPANNNTIKNNVIFGSNLAIRLFSSTGTVQEYNACETALSCGTTGKVNLTAITNITVSTSDFTHKSGSTGIDVGTSVSTRSSYNGSNPDLGPHEVFTFATCSVEDGDASKVRVTFNNNVFPPLKPTASPGTFTARKATVNDVITASTVTGTNRVDLTLTDAIVGGNAVDISWAAGNLTDSALIGNATNQPYRQTLTNQSCTNNVGAASTHVYTQTVFAWHGLRGSEAAPVSAPYATAPENTNIFVSVGGKGSARLRIGVSCTIEDCPPTGFFPRYSKNAGAYTNIVPDTFGADNIALCGTGPDPDVPQSGTATTLQQSGSGTFVPGALVTTSNAIPTVDMALNGRTELEYCFSWDTDTSPGDTFDIRLYQQDGTALNAYTVTPRATIRAMGAGSGF